MEVDQIITVHKPRPENIRRLKQTLEIPNLEGKNDPSPIT